MPVVNPGITGIIPDPLEVAAPVYFTCEDSAVTAVFFYTGVAANRGADRRPGDTGDYPGAGLPVAFRERREIPGTYCPFLGAPG